MSASRLTGRLLITLLAAVLPVLLAAQLVRAAGDPQAQLSNGLLGGPLLLAQADTTVFWTLFGPELCRIQAEQTALSIENDCWHAHITLRSDAKQSLVASAAVTGTVESTLDLT